MKKLNALLLVIPILLFVMCGSVPGFAAGSFFDTIQSADNGKAVQELAPTKQFNHEGPYPPAPAAPTGSTAPTITVPKNSEPFRIFMGSMVQKILAQGKTILTLGQRYFPIYLPPTRIAAPPGPSSLPHGTGATIQVGSTTVIIGSGTYHPPTGSGTGPIPPYQPPAGVDALRQEMANKFGIKAEDGDSHWSEMELREALVALDRIPIVFRGNTTKIKRMKSYQGNPDVLGWVTTGIPTANITDSASQRGKFVRTIVHEMTHCFQASNRSVQATWESQFWPGGVPTPPSITTYGNSQPKEDMAECVAIYYTSPGALRATNPARYEFIKAHIMNGVEF